MTVTEAIQAILVGAADLTDRVPAHRIRVPGDWEKLLRPYIIHQPVSEDAPAYTYNQGRSSLRAWDFYQVSIFSDTYAEGEDIAEVALAALDGNHDGVQLFYRGGPWYAGFDVPTGVHHFALDFRVVGALSA